MIASGAGPYLPWSNRVFVDGESSYSLISKIGWFARRPPARYMREIFTSRAMFDRSCDFDWHAPIWSLVLRARGLAENVELWARHIEVARAHHSAGMLEGSGNYFCAQCLAKGIHLDVWRYTSLRMCLLHERPLQTVCPACKTESPLSYCKDTVMPFCCGQCGACLLESDDERADLTRYFKDCISAVRAHSQVGKALQGVPAFLLPSDLGKRPRWTERLTVVNLVDSQMLVQSVQARQAAVFSIKRIACDTAGLQRLETEMLKHDPKAGPSAQDQRRHEKLAQLRAGCYVLNRFSPHVPCMAAASDSLAATGGTELGLHHIEKICAIGWGFALWEQARRITGCNLTREVSAYTLRQNPRIRDYTLYVLEKSSLLSVILAFCLDMVDARRAVLEGLAGHLAYSRPADTAHALHVLWASEEAILEAVRCSLERVSVGEQEARLTLTLGRFCRRHSRPLEATSRTTCAAFTARFDARARLPFLVPDTPASDAYAKFLSPLRGSQPRVQRWWEEPR
jgi:hypothetical protein